MPFYSFFLGEWSTKPPVSLQAVLRHNAEMLAPKYIIVIIDGATQLTYDTPKDRKEKINSNRIANFFSSLLNNVDVAMARKRAIPENIRIKTIGELFQQFDFLFVGMGEGFSPEYNFLGIAREVWRIFMNSVMKSAKSLPHRFRKNILEYAIAMVPFCSKDPIVMFDASIALNNVENFDHVKEWGALMSVGECHDSTASTDVDDYLSVNILDGCMVISSVKEKGKVYSKVQHHLIDLARRQIYGELAWNTEEDLYKAIYKTAPLSAAFLSYTFSSYFDSSERRLENRFYFSATTSQENTWEKQLGIMTTLRRQDTMPDHTCAMIRDAADVSKVLNQLQDMILLPATLAYPPYISRAEIHEQQLTLDSMTSCSFLRNIELMLRSKSCISAKQAAKQARPSREPLPRRQRLICELFDAKLHIYENIALRLDYCIEWQWNKRKRYRAAVDTDNSETIEIENIDTTSATEIIHTQEMLQHIKQLQKYIMSIISEDSPCIDQSGTADISEDSSYLDPVSTVGISENQPCIDPVRTVDMSSCNPYVLLEDMLDMLQDCSVSKNEVRNHAEYTKAIIENPKDVAPTTIVSSQLSGSSTTPGAPSRTASPSLLVKCSHSIE